LPDGVEPPDGCAIGQRVVGFERGLFLTVYAHNERADISQADRNDFRNLTALLVESYARRSR